MRNPRRPWWLIAALTACGALASAYGCGRTVLVTDDSPIRIGPATTGRVYRLIEGDWVLSDDRVKLPEGWYAVPPRFVLPEDLVSEGKP